MRRNTTGRLPLVSEEKIVEFVHCGNWKDGFMSKQRKKMTEPPNKLLNLEVTDQQIIVLCKNLMKISLPEIRIKIRDEIMDGYCRHCGNIELPGERCQCENEE